MPDNLCQPYPIPVVRALIENDRGRILLLRRAVTASGPGSWCLPGGKIDYGQTMALALATEIKEETPLQLLSAEFFCLQDSLPVGSGGIHCLNLYFHCRVMGEIRLNEESLDYAWVGPWEVDNYDVVFRIEEAIRRFFESRQDGTRRS